ncbi:MAG: histidine kinase N-terminal 7TM domain-containing protein [Haloarculaceae archaeon]
MSLTAWPVVGSLASGVGTVSLVWRLRSKRDRPGAWWFFAGLVFQAVWCVGYAVALTIFDPTLRWGLAVLVWTAMSATGVCFLTFALKYTGRGEVVRYPAYRVLFGAPAATAVLAMTNPWHGLLWRDFTVTRVLGVAGVTYAFQPAAYLLVGGGALLVAAGSALLFDTVVSYGPLYRSEAAAVGLSTVVPGVALLAWLDGVGPWPALNLTPVFFLPHVLLDGYAFVVSDMFEFHPVTQRVGERIAMSDLGSPVVIVDERGRVVDLNAAMERAVDAEETTALTRPLSTVLGTDDLDLDGGEQSVTVEIGGRQRTFHATPSRLRSGTGTPVGYAVVLQDVTEAVQREQRLAVLNRVLRHNLRNDLTVVRESIHETVDRTDAETVETLLDRADRKVDSLLRVSEQARTAERVLDGRDSGVETDIEALLTEIADDAVADADGTVTVDVPERLVVRADPSLLRVAVEPLVENALEHATGPVHVAARATDGGAVVVEVSDEGPGIPEHELAAIRDGSEDALTHGSGLGLWLADWAVTSLKGSLSFDTGPDGTTATVRLPSAGDDR